jgi:hypothetical protein
LHYQVEEDTMWFSIASITAVEAIILTIAIRTQRKQGRRQS